LRRIVDNRASNQHPPASCSGRAVSAAIAPFGQCRLDHLARDAGGCANASPFPTADALPNVHAPMLLVNGHERDFMMVTSKATFDAIDHVPAFYGARHNAGILLRALSRTGSTGHGAETVTVIAGSM